MNNLYPLKFMPLFKPKIWGGHNIQDVMGIDISPLPNCGEVWMLSDVEGNESVVENGFLAENTLSELLEIYMEDLAGEKVYEQCQNSFPLLIKLIDATDDLSIQVHPDDAMAQKYGFENGKNEMWYVIDAKEDARIINGFKNRINQNIFLKHLKDKTLPEILKSEKADKGDVFYIPAGRVHALGAGLLIAEIQQTSDVTYRVYDWDRPGDDGKMRELHIKEALEAIDFSDEGNAKTEYTIKPNKTTELINVSYFTTNLLQLDKNLQKDFTELDSFVIYICIDGNCKIKALDTIVDLKKGETVLIPAIGKIVEIYPQDEIKLLEVYIS